MDVSQYDIYRITTKDVRNEQNEIIFRKGTVVHCVEDLGSLWLARPKDTEATPRMLPKNECDMLPKLSQTG